MKKKIKSIKYKKQRGGAAYMYGYVPTSEKKAKNNAAQLVQKEAIKQAIPIQSALPSAVARFRTPSNNPSIKETVAEEMLNALNAQTESNETKIKLQKNETYRLIVESRFNLLFTFIGFVIKLATSPMGTMFIFLIIVLEICIAIFNILDAGVRKNIVNPIRTIIPIRVKSGRIKDRSWTILWKLVKYLFSLIS
jgi:hypothetical protein